MMSQLGNKKTRTYSNLYSFQSTTIGKKHSLANLGGDEYNLNINFDEQKQPSDKHPTETYKSKKLHLLKVGE